MSNYGNTNVNKEILRHPLSNFATAPQVGYVLVSIDANGNLDWADINTLVTPDGNGIYTGGGPLSGDTQVTQGANNLSFSTVLPLGSPASWFSTFQINAVNNEPSAYMKGLYVSTSGSNGYTGQFQNNTAGTDVLLATPSYAIQATGSVFVNGGTTTLKGTGTTSETSSLLLQKSTGAEVMRVRNDGFVGIGTSTQIGNEVLGVNGNFATSGVASFGGTTIAGATLNAPSGWGLNFGNQTSLYDSATHSAAWLRTTRGALKVTQNNINTYYELSNDAANKSSISHLIASIKTTGGVDQVANAEYKMTSSYWDGAAGQTKTGSIILKSLNTTGATSMNFDISGTNRLKIEEDGRTIITSSFNSGGGLAILDVSSTTGNSAIWIDAPTGFASEIGLQVNNAYVSRLYSSAGYTALSTLGMFQFRNLANNAVQAYKNENGEWVFDNDATGLTTPTVGTRAKFVGSGYTNLTRSLLTTDLSGVATFSVADDGTTYIKGNVGIGVAAGSNVLSMRTSGVLGMDISNGTYNFNILPRGTSTLTELNTDNIGYQFSMTNGYFRLNRTGAAGAAMIYLNGNATSLALSGTTTGAVHMEIFNSGSVGIGTAEETSAKLAVDSTTKGFLPPRMTGAQAEAISTPAEGLMVYATSAGAGDITAKGWWGWNGTNWTQLG